MISMIHLLRRRENLRGTVNEEQLSKRRDTVARMRASEMEIFFFHGEDAWLSGQFLKFSKEKNRVKF